MIYSPFYEFELRVYNDGTPALALAKSTRHTTGGHATVYWKYEADKWTMELFQLACIKDLLARNGVETTLIMPYVPNARMDRTRSPNEAFTLKTFCNMINAMGFDHVHVLDPHSDVTPALLDRCVVHTAGKLVDRVADHIRTEGGHEVIVFPDAGAEHKYASERDIAFFTKYGYITGNKTRDWETSWITGYTLTNGELARGKDVLIVDDIVAHGYTMKFLIEELEKYEPRSISICCTHLEESYFDGILYKEHPTTPIYTTDSIVKHTESQHITVYKVEDTL